jgi:hypothetical protein
VKEKVLRSKIVKALNAYGKGHWVVTVATMYGTGGLPDIVGCYQGYYYGLEVKLPGKEHTLTERQAYVLKKIQRAGGKSAVVTSVDQAMNFVFANQD